MTASLATITAELNAALVGAAPGIPAANDLCLASVGLLGVDGAAVSMVFDGASRGTFGSSGETSRRLDEYQFTYGEGPCLDAVSAREAVLVPDMDSPDERRWPAFAGAVLNEGIRGVFAMPIMITSVCVGALDLFRAAPGPLERDQLAGAAVAAKLASWPLIDLLSGDVPSHRRLDGVQVSGLRTDWSLVEDIDRVEVYQATGMLISHLDVDPAEALLRLRAHAIATNQTAREVAIAILERRLELERDDQGHGSVDDDTS